MSELRIDDFSGGMTDNYLNGPLNACQTIDNFLIDKNKKPYIRYGSEVDNADYYQTPAGNQRISNLYYFGSLLLKQSARNLYYIGGSGWVTLQGPVSSNAAYAAGTVANFTSFSEWNGHLMTSIDSYSKPRKMYVDGSSVLQIRTAGLPDLASSPTITPNAADGSSYIYYFFHYYEYTVGTRTFADYGPITTVACANGGNMTGAGHYNAISAIPVLANSTTECYDTTNIKVYIYRTTNGGTTGKYVGNVTNGTTTFTDNVADGSLGVDIYNLGGVVENDPPPLAKYLTMANEVCWYANCQISSVNYTNRVFHSLYQDPDSVPTNYYIDIDEPITGINAIGKYPMVFAENRLWRLEGFVDNTGHGVIEKFIVSDSVGAVSNGSIVRTNYGLFFAALDGFYFTDGYKVQKLSEHLNDTYSGLVDTATKKGRLYGTRDPVSGRIYWAVQATAGNSENDACYVLDPTWGIGPQSCFTTFSGSSNFRPTALCFISGSLYRADSRGYTFKHLSTDYNDPVVNTSTNPSTWASTAVIYDLKSCAFNFGTDVSKKYITQIIVNAKNDTNLSIQIESANDDSGDWKDLKEYRLRSNITWGDDDVIWGDPEVVWKRLGAIYIKRMFPKGSLRCVHKQIRFTNANTIIIRSDDYCTATVNATAKTFLLDDTATYSWPTDSVGYNLCVPRDNYVTEFVITARTATTLTVTDTGNLLVAGSQKWLMKGYRKNERLSLEAYSINYDYFGESHKGYSTSESGENA
jgi:hypothetical protein